MPLNVDKAFCLFHQIKSELWYFICCKISMYFQSLDYDMCENELLQQEETHKTSKVSNIMLYLFCYFFYKLRRL